MQLIVTQRGRTQDARIGQQVRVLVAQIRQGAIRTHVGQGRQGGLGSVVIAVRCGEAGLKKLGSSRISADHAGDLGSGHPHLRGCFRHSSAQDCRIDGQTVPDAPDVIDHCVRRAPNEEDLAQLCKRLQRQIVAIGLFDVRHQRQQQISRAGLVGGKHELTGALQFAGNRHWLHLKSVAGGDGAGCNRPGSGGRAMHARRFQSD